MNASDQTARDLEFTENAYFPNPWLSDHPRPYPSNLVMLSTGSASVGI